MVALGTLGTRGVLHRDISGSEITTVGPRGPFDIRPVQAGEYTTYPTLWAHDARKETHLFVHPDSAATPRTGCKDRAIELWEKTASRLHFNLDFQLNSQPLAACLTPRQSIGGRAWPNFLCTEPQWETPILLWANTTLGLIAFWSNASTQQQGRATTTISKLPLLPVIDPRTLDATQLKEAEAILEQFKGRTFLPANEAYRDTTRIAFDEAVLTRMLKLPKAIIEPLETLRMQWCTEPSVHGGKSTKPSAGPQTPPAYDR